MFYKFAPKEKPAKYAHRLNNNFTFSFQTLTLTEQCDIGYDLLLFC